MKSSTNCNLRSLISYSFSPFISVIWGIFWNFTKYYDNSVNADNRLATSAYLRSLHCSFNFSIAVNIIINFLRAAIENVRLRLAISNYLMSLHIEYTKSSLFSAFYLISYISVTIPLLSSSTSYTSLQILFYMTACSWMSSYNSVCSVANSAEIFSISESMFTNDYSLGKRELICLMQSKFAE
jgi:hypothetical protein